MGNTCYNEQKKTKTKKYRFSKQITLPRKFFHQNSKLKITISTWIDNVLPDIRGESKIKQQSFQIDGDAVLTYQNYGNSQFILKPGNLDLVKTNFASNEDTQILLNINVQKNSTGFQIGFHQYDHIYELVIGKRQLKQGNRILIGGTEYKFVKFIEDREQVKKKIKKMSHVLIPNQSNGVIPSFAFIQSFKQIAYSETNLEQKLCRICTGEQLTTQDPLISPCDCTGSIKYYHLNCWTNWACKSEQITEDMYVGHVIRESCEICKKSLIENQYYRDNMAAILSSAHKIASPFIVLEGRHSLPNFPYYRNLKLNYIIYSLSKKSQLTIGRSSKMQVKTLLDNSISSHNTMIQLKDGILYVSDADSKHGTYLRVTQNLLIDSDKPRNILFKNSLIEFKII